MHLKPSSFFLFFLIGSFIFLRISGSLFTRFSAPTTLLTDRNFSPNSIDGRTDLPPECNTHCSYPNWNDLYNAVYTDRKPTNKPVIDPKKYAYATLITSDNFVQVLQVLAYSLKRTNTTASIIALTPRNRLSLESRKALESSGFLIYELDDVIPPRGATSRFSEQFLKLRLWELIQFEKIIYIDADALVIRNLDHLFLTSLDFHVTADVAGSFDSFIGGFFVLKPNLFTSFELLNSIYIYNNYYNPRFAEQSFLNYFAKGSATRLPLTVFPAQNFFCCPYTNLLNPFHIGAIHYASGMIIHSKPWSFDGVDDPRVSKDVHKIWLKVREEMNRGK
ncbi:hypothetical protein RCL1_006546 [Eukaryota sp. TZLM3-RCL]